MVKYKTDNFIELLNLLQLAVLFMADDLINDITDTIIIYWLNPEKVIDVWLLAQELAISLLTDVCLSVCLDRFMDLPISSLIELPIKNLKQLIENINVRSTTKYSHYILHEWMDRNTVSSLFTCIPSIYKFYREEYCFFFFFFLMDLFRLLRLIIT